MHFSIPDTQEFIDGSGNSFVSYNIHINGLFHCSVRYKQMLNLHEQLVKEIDITLPTFPPKKFFPLTANQQEDRRLSLEKYIQTIGQNPAINNSELLNGFLLNAQQETSARVMENDEFLVHLMNNQQIKLQISTGDSSSKVLEKVCRHLNLPPEYDSYFSLFIVVENENGDVNILRKLHDFESPLLTRANINFTNVQVVLGKGYWDVNNDSKLMHDPVALNLLYIQAVAEINRGWIIVPSPLQAHLHDCHEKNNKNEYLKLVSSFKYYGFIQFAVCYCDFPQPNTKVQVAIGRNELNLRIFMENNEEHEAIFKVTRMRCWRITTLQNNFIDKNNKEQETNDYSLELSFEYLVAKNQLQWITISSDQSILMSVCLQSMIDELLLKHVNSPKNNQLTGKSWTYIMRDGHSRITMGSNPAHSAPGTPTINSDRVQKDKLNQESVGKSDDTVIKKLSERFSNVKSKKTDCRITTRSKQPGTSDCDIMENNAFHMIGDEDL
ncbi:sorting nexin-17 [Microplitis demolitor]|uniref:sorting nexin-17 n=1 Tax=Microplitis demolitor TaxID=69319 RepID=UPI0006D50B8D|nr:sorting nexin-17 [Microplitis demolitor]